MNAEDAENTWEVVGKLWENCGIWSACAVLPTEACVSRCEEFYEATEEAS